MFDMGSLPKGVRITAQQVRACNDMDILGEWLDALIAQGELIQADLDRRSRLRDDEEWRDKALKARAAIRTGMTLVSNRIAVLRDPGAPDYTQFAEQMRGELGRVHKTAIKAVEAVKRLNYSFAFEEAAFAMLDKETANKIGARAREILAENIEVAERLVTASTDAKNGAEAE